jgi:hypothetical protein
MSHVTRQAQLGVKNSDIIYDLYDSAVLLEGWRHESARHSQGVETSNSKKRYIIIL